MATAKTLGKQAERDAQAGVGVTQPGMCQRWMRERLEEVAGAKYDRFRAGTAHESMKLWAGSEYAVSPSNGSQIGDILYIRGTSGNPAGHVGIRVSGNRVAENSTRRSGRVRGGIGFVSLEDFGKVALIVRVPEAK